MLFKLYVQVKSRLPNSTRFRHFFVGFLCAMTLFCGLYIRKLTHLFFQIYVYSQFSVLLHQMNE